MANYCYRCTNCGATITLHLRDLVMCGECHEPAMVRDYRAENVGMTGLVQLKKEREGGSARDTRDLFLPTAEELATPEDPSGQKALQDWNERHAPAEGNKTPLRPETEKKVF